MLSTYTIRVVVMLMNLLACVQPSAGRVSADNTSAIHPDLLLQ